MPRKVRDLVGDLVDAGFVERDGKGSHRNFVHPLLTRLVTIPGRDGDDAKRYLERAVRLAISEVNRCREATDT